MSPQDNEFAVATHVTRGVLAPGTSVLVRVAPNEQGTHLDPFDAVIVDFEVSVDSIGSVRAVLHELPATGVVPFNPIEPARWRDRGQPFPPDTLLLVDNPDPALLPLNGAVLDEQVKFSEVTIPRYLLRTYAAQPREWVLEVRLPATATSPIEFTIETNLRPVYGGAVA